MRWSPLFNPLKCVPETIPIFDFQTKISEMYQSLFENRHNMENFRLNSENANFRWRIATDARTTLWTSIYYNRHPNPIYINIHFRVERTKKGFFVFFSRVFPLRYFNNWRVWNASENLNGEKIAEYILHRGHRG